MKRFHAPGDLPNAGRQHGAPAFRIRSGQSLVEFALVLPMLLMVIFGILDFGRLLKDYQTIVDSAREGARRAVVSTDPLPTEADVDTAVMQKLREGGIVNSSTATITMNWTCDDSSPGCTWDDSDSRGPVDVTVRYRHNFLFIGPFLGLITGSDGVTLGTTTTMRKEY